MTDFKGKVVYEIYPRSFRDTNGDGVGDLPGITEKLDYLAWLGVDCLWLTPIFRSPFHDNGYDISDYCSVDPAFGTMADLENLIGEAGKRDIGIMLDMVFNHTSVQHPWFQRALAGEKKYQDFYIFRDGTPERPPTNWESKFGGSAWEHVPHLGKWYLHLFDRTQADLNWDNPQVREELKQVIRFWKAKGVRGFRFDVVNLVSKPSVFRDDDRGDGRRFYTDGPNIHTYLKELVADTGIGDMITVGEMSSTSLENCVRYTCPGEKELSMVFSFYHLKVDYRDGQKWQLQPPDLSKLEDVLRTWQLRMQEAGGWNALFWCNHDQPRAISRFGDDRLWWKESATMLATCLFLMRGTPFIYQGEEIGMTNPGFRSLGEYRDVESLNAYEILRRQGKANREAIEILEQRSRDNGRTPMQWNSGLSAGFSSASPWIGVADNYRTVNVEAQVRDPDSVLNYYRNLIRFRKEHPALTDGQIAFLETGTEAVFGYRRSLCEEQFVVLSNLTGASVGTDIPHGTARYSFGNYDGPERSGERMVLRPYETMVLTTG